MLLKDRSGQGRKAPLRQPREYSDDAGVGWSLPLLSRFPFPASRFLAEAKRLSEFRAGFRVARRDHRVIGTKAPFRPVLLGGEAARREMALERAVLPSILEADNMVGPDRLVDGHWRRQLFLRRGRCRRPQERGMYRADQARQVRRATRRCWIRRPTRRRWSAQHSSGWSRLNRPAQKTPDAVSVRRLIAQLPSVQGLCVGRN